MDSHLHSMIRRCVFRVGLVLLLPAVVRPAWAADNVAGNLILFNSSGAWCWYQDERAIVDLQAGTAGKMLVGSVNTSTGVNVEVVTFDLATGVRSKFGLANMDEDDHAAPALLIRPDGRYLAAYAMHYDTQSRFRVSTNPRDSSSWSSETTFNWNTQVAGFQSGNFRNAYNNLYHLSAENRIYDLTRAFQKSPNMLLSTGSTGTWSWGTPDPVPGGYDDNDYGQLTQGNNIGYVNGYYKYASNGVDKIHFIATEEHPRDYNNSIYHAYIQGGKMYKSNGTLIDNDIFSNSYIPKANPTEMTQVFAAQPLGAGYNRCWVVDLELDSNGNPYGIFSSRWNNSETDHRFHYARYDGTTWTSYDIAKAGYKLFAAEQDYTGLVALHPNDPNVVYISTPINPITGLETTNHEIYKGVTSTGGASWTWTAITAGSNVDNYRPIIPSWDANNTVVLWNRGTMTTSQNYDQAVVGIIDRKNLQVDRVNYVDATTSNTTRSDGSPIGATGPSSAEGAADGNWHWRTGVGNGGNGVLASGATGSENAPTLKTVLSGLADGAYDIFAYFWANPAEDWRIQAGFSTSNMLTFRDMAAQQAEQSQFDPAQTITLSGSGNTWLYRAYVGRANIAGGSTLNVFIDDLVSTTTGSTRTWYDGVGYAWVHRRGDYNGDGIVDAADIGLLWGMIQNNNPNADVNGDTLVNGQDMDYLIAAILNTYYGDANLDGQVDITDLGALATAWQTAGTWVNGDFNHDGFIDITDLGTLATNWQAGVGNSPGLSFGDALASLGLPPVSVPEPGGVMILALGMALQRRGRWRA